MRGLSLMKPQRRRHSGTALHAVLELQLPIWPHPGAELQPHDRYVCKFVAQVFLAQGALTKIEKKRPLRAQRAPSEVDEDDGYRARLSDCLKTLKALVI
jgi:hypothetical protein